MGQHFLLVLGEFVKDYPFENVHRMLAMLILAMIRIRKRPGFVLESPSHIALFRCYLSKALKDKEGADLQNFNSKLIELFVGINMLSNFENEDVAEIKEYCLELSATKQESLEKFLQARFGIEPVEPLQPKIFHSNELEFLFSRLVTASGDDKENFILSLSESVCPKNLYQAAQEFYEKQGYVYVDLTDFSLILQKDERDLYITISKNDYIARITVFETS
jgi:hypothetical protein